MKKIRKTELEELAKTMPILSKNELASMIGGKVVLVDNKGVIINLNNAQEDQYSEIRDMFKDNNLDYSNLDSFDDTTYFIVAGEDSLKMKAQEGTYTSNGNTSTSCDVEGDIEGNAITKDVFEFLANNTDVEWGYYSASGGEYGRLVTSNSGTFAHPLDDVNARNYNEFYHSHPAKVKHEENEGSKNDVKYAKQLEELEYNNIGIYDAKKGEYIYYDSEKEEYR